MIDVSFSSVQEVLQLVQKSQVNIKLLLYGMLWTPAWLLKFGFSQVHTWL